MLKCIEGIYKKGFIMKNINKIKQLAILCACLPSIHAFANNFVQVIQKDYTTNYEIRPPYLQFNKLSANDAFSYGIDKNGNLWVTGRNLQGGLGLGDFNKYNNWTQTELTNVTSVASGTRHGYAISNGRLFVAGKNSEGQLGLEGLGDEQFDSSDNNISGFNRWTDTGIDHFVKVYKGYNYGYALKNDGTVWATGENQHGQLGIGDKGVDLEGNFVNKNEWTQTNLVSPDKIASGVMHAYALKDGVIWVVGDNFYGQLGLSIDSDNLDTEDRNEWIKTNITGVSDIAVGSGQGYYLKDGEVYGIGRNEQGQLGLGETENKYFWTKTESLSEISDIESGYHFAYIIKDGTIWSTGRNTEGQLGLGDNLSRSLWTNTNFNVGGELSLGWTHAFVQNEEYFYGTGSNSEGQMGIGTYEHPIKEFRMREFIPE